MSGKFIFIPCLAVLLAGISFFVFDGGEKNSSAPPDDDNFTVYVSGQVKNPSLVTLENTGNLRAADAVNAAGGLTDSADSKKINLAEPLIDGQHIHIPTKKFLKQEAEKNSSSGGEVVDINSANESELQKIKGVGQATAKRIIDYRTQHGDFKSVEEIKNVRGIGEKTFEKMKNFMTVRNND